MPLNPNYSGVQQNIEITEVSGLQSAIDTVQTNIENETTDRLNGDVTLSNSLQALEITVNTKQSIINDGDLTISKVSGLQSTLDLEQTTRTNAVDDLQTQVIDLGNTLGTSTENVQSRITTEIDDRTNADLTLQSAIDTKQPIIGDGDLIISHIDGLQTALDTKQAIINDGDLSISKVDGLQTALDSLSSGGGGGGGGGGSSIFKEYFSRITYGQTISTARGDITIPNLLGEQLLNGAALEWEDLNGSVLNYTPPENTNIVEYELNFYAYSEGVSESAFALEFYIDGVSQTPTRAKVNVATTGATSTWGQTRYTFKTVIEINGTTDNTKCFLDTWNTTKTLKLRVSKLKNNLFSFHSVKNLLVTYPSVSMTNTIVPPILTIKAY